MHVTEKCYSAKTWKQANKQKKTDYADMKHSYIGRTCVSYHSIIIIIMNDSASNRLRMGRCKIKINAYTQAYASVCKQCILFWFSTTTFRCPKIKMKIKNMFCDALRWCIHVYVWVYLCACIQKKPIANICIFVMPCHWYNDTHICIYQNI